MSYNPPRSGLINAGPRRNPFSAGGSVSDNTGRSTVINSNYVADNRTPQAVYNDTMRRETEKYEQSALKNFFDFALSDTVNDKYEEILTNQAEIQLGDLIANSPDIVEGWKQGDAAQRAYISNLNPIAQNLIEEKLSEQVANDYTGSVTAALAASPIMTSATATPEQLSAERARIMSEAGSSTGYTSLSPYWIAQTASDISRVQSATEAKLDAARQKNKAAHNLTKYAYANAESYYQKSQGLSAYAPQLTEEQTGQAYRAMSQEWEQAFVMVLKEH